MVVTKILPERIRGMEIDRMAFAPGASMGGTPHVTGTKEYFYCLAGGFQVLVEDGFAGSELAAVCSR